MDKATSASNRGVARNKLDMDQTHAGVREAQRRRETPVFISGELVEKELERANHVYIVDNRLGFANRTHRFWINHLAAGGEDSQMWQTIGHRHTVEAVILFMDGFGYSVVDGVRYDWRAGDFLCVPMFAWHRHVNLSDQKARYAASTTGPLMMGIGQAVYEDENYPELWIFATKDEDPASTLIPGGADTANWDQGEFPSADAELYREEVAFAQQEERHRRESRVMVRSDEITFSKTPMGEMAYVVDARVGFATKALGTLILRVPPGGRSGSHRHLYDEINYVLSGSGQATVDGVTYDIKSGDTLAIPSFALHQYVGASSEPLGILVHHTRPMLENLGLSLVKHEGMPDF